MISPALMQIIALVDLTFYLFYFYFQLLNPLLGKGDMKHHQVYLLNASCHSYAARITVYSILIMQQNFLMCKREEYMISPMYWKESVSLKRIPKTTLNGCKQNVVYLLFSEISPPIYFIQSKICFVHFSLLSEHNQFPQNIK